MHTDLYSIHYSMHTIRRRHISVLKNTRTQRCAHHICSYTFIHPHKRCANKRGFIYTWTQRHVCTHAHTEEQSHILTYLYICTRRIYNTHHRHTHAEMSSYTHEYTYRPTVACTYIYLHCSTTYIPGQTMVYKHNTYMHIIRTAQTATFTYLYFQIDTQAYSYIHT